MANLEKNRVFTTESLLNLKNQAVTLMETADTVCEQLEAERDTIEALFKEIPSEYQDVGLRDSLSQVPSKMRDPIYSQTSDQFQKTLDKLATQIPLTDEFTAEAISLLTEATAAATHMINELESLLYSNAPYTTMEQFAAALSQCKQQWGDTIAIDLQIAMAETMLKGIYRFMETYGDPVNTATGNFLHTHTDLTIQLPIPLAFTRTYNAMDKRKGILGRGWVHNNEQKLIIKNKDTILRITPEGREETYTLTQAGHYRETHTGRLTLRQQENTYHLEEEGLTAIYDQEGRLLRLEKGTGTAINLIYDQDQKLTGAQASTGESLKYHYDGEGKLWKVTDHTGRTTTFTYQSKKLAAVTDPQGATLTYRYGDNNRIREIITPENQTTLQNEYDNHRRIISQTLADGGKIHFTYLDKANAVKVTQQNGNEITYCHDSQMRHIKTIDTNGSRSQTYDANHNITTRQDKIGNCTQYAYDEHNRIICITDPLGHQTKYTYNREGKVIRTQYPDHGVTENTYDSLGRLLESKDQEGAATKFSYPGEDHKGEKLLITLPDTGNITITFDQRQNIQTINLPAGNTLRYTYDALNRVEQTQNGADQSFFYTYDPNHRLTAVVRPDGARQSYRYNADGKVTEITDFDGHAACFAYNSMDKIKEYRDKEGNTTVYTYDIMQNVETITDPLGAVTAYAYDQNNNLKTITNPLGGTTAYTHDPVGNLLERTAPDGTTTTLAYDAMERPVSVTDAEGNKTLYTYDACGRIITITDPMGNTTTTTYDKAGRKTQEKDVLGAITSYTYTPLGKIETIIHPDGTTTTHTYKPGGQLKEIIHPDGTKETYRYDPIGRLTCQTMRDGSALHYTYDSLDQILTVTQKTTSEPTTILRQETYTYDPLGNTTSVTQRDGSCTTYQYTPGGNLQTVTGPMGNRIHYTYDAKGRLLSITETNSQSHQEHPFAQTTFCRNPMGHIETITDPLGNQETYTYDTCGRAIRKTDKEGNHISFAYTPTGKIKEIQYPDHTTVHYTYDALSLLTRIEDLLGVTTIEKDPKGRPLSITDPLGQTITYEWDPMDQKLAATYPDGSRQDYTYAPGEKNRKFLGKPSAIRYNKNTIHYTYDPFGRIQEKQILHDGCDETFTTCYTYSSGGKLNTLSHHRQLPSGHIQPIEHHTYTYAPSGSLARLEKKHFHTQEPEPEYTSCDYTYDTLDRLCEVYENQAIRRKYTYHPQGDRSALYEYPPKDPAALLKDQTSGEPLCMTTYHYNPLHQLVEQTKTTPGGSLPPWETHYNYDKRGNLTAIQYPGQEPLTFTYDITGHLIQEHQGEEKITHTYDPMGNRIKTQSSEGTIQYLHDPSHPVSRLAAIHCQTDGAQYRRTFLWHDGMEAMTQASSLQEETHYYCLSDQNKTPLYIIDPLSGESRSYSYDEYGIPQAAPHDPPYGAHPHQTAPQGPTIHTIMETPIGYCGYEPTAVEGIYQAGARQYHAHTGSFTSKDQLKYTIPGIPESLDLYTYAKHNPLRYTDPTGHEIAANDNLQEVLALWQSQLVTGLDILIDYPPNAQEEIFLASLITGSWINYHTSLEAFQILGIFKQESGLYGLYNYAESERITGQLKALGYNQEEIDMIFAQRSWAQMGSTVQDVMNQYDEQQRQQVMMLMDLLAASAAGALSRGDGVNPYTKPGGLVGKLRNTGSIKGSSKNVDDIVNQVGDSIKNNPLRQEYENAVKDLGNYEIKLRTQGLNDKEIAELMHQARRDLGVQYKDLTPEPLREYIYEVNRQRYGDPLGGSFDFFEEKYMGNYQKIIEGATRPNADVDTLLKGFEDWLINQ